MKKILSKLFKRLKSKEKNGLENDKSIKDFIDKLNSRTTISGNQSITTATTTTSGTNGVYSTVSSNSQSCITVHPGSLSTINITGGHYVNCSTMNMANLSFIWQSEEKTNFLGCIKSILRRNLTQLSDESIIEIETIFQNLSEDRLHDLITGEDFSSNVKSLKDFEEKDILNYFKLIYG